MSESGKDNPGDPWAKWRKPEAGATKVDRKGEPKSEARPAAPPVESAAAEPLADKPAANPSGALGVNKAALGEPGARKRPLRGGALPRKPRSGVTETSGAPPREKTSGASGKPAERKADRPDALRKPRPESVAGENPWARAGKPREVRGDRRDERVARPVKATAPSAENPWASAGKPAERRPVRPVDKGPVTAPVARADAPSGVRLSKVMSERGLCSRREADLWIERGWVFVNGEQISELGTRIDPSADITISKEAQKDQAKQVTILLHKPVGYVSGQPEPGCIPAVTLITPETQVVQSGDPEFKPWMLRGLAPAGRLDVDSTGLLVLTSDGRVAKRLIGEDSEAEKEYLVRVSGEMIKGGLDLLRHGLELDGKPLKPAWVKQLNEDQLHFILKEGKKRQIRRMCELVGLKVIGLKRVRIGRIRLGDLPLGQWRFLREGEAF